MILGLCGKLRQQGTVWVVNGPDCALQHARKTQKAAGQAALMRRHPPEMLPAEGRERPD
jgi:hypothetical protein